MPTRRVSRRAATLIVVCVTSIALIVGSGVVEARGAPNWMTRLIRAVARRAEQPVAQTPPPDTVVVFGPKTFATGSGSSGNFVEAFTLPSPDSAGYVLRVTNGVNGAARATDGAVRLNGRVVAGGQQLAQIAAGATRDFAVTVATVDTIAVNLSAANTAIRVSLVSLPDPTFRVFGPKTYTRSDHTAAIVDTFTVPVGAVAPAYLCVRNGDADGTHRNAGFKVTLNGTQLLAGTELTANVPGFLIPVTLIASNVLSVQRVAGGVAGARLTLCATATDAIRPAVTISAPAPSFITKLAQVVVAGMVKEQTAVRITLSGQAATVVPDTGGRTNFTGSVPLATEGANVITVSAVDANGNRTDSTRTVIRDTQAPVVTLNGLPATPSFRSDTTLTVTGTITDATAVTANINGLPLVIDSVTHAYSKTLALQRGSNFVTLLATDAAGNATTIVRQVTTDVVPPTLTVPTPVAGTVTKLLVSHVTGTATGATAVLVTVNGVPAPLGTGGTFATDVTLVEGSNTIVIVATNAAGLTTTIARTVIRDTTAPTLSVTTPANGSTTTSAQTTVAGTVIDATAVHVTVNGVSAPLTSGAFSVTVALANGPNTITVIATDSASNVSTVTTVVTRTGGATGFAETLGIDSSVHAPKLDPTVMVPITAASTFLYTGPSAPQQGVSAGTIQLAQAGILRGRVLDRGGIPLGGVTVRVLNHPEYGAVQSRANGLYELVVNAGGTITLDYQKTGVIPAQRTVVSEQQDFTVVPEVALVTLDPASTVVSFAAPIEVARGSAVTDRNGTRQATMLFAQGTVATATQPNGTSRVLPSLTVRATEYTVGPNGKMAMPAALPPTSEYTYAVELSADEVPLSGTEALTFSTPVAFYVENNRKFPVGMAVPMGYYDRQRGVWIPENNGRVVRVLSVSAGSAVLDVVGDSTPAAQTALDSLGVTSSELNQVGQLYTPGQTLWRASITHFSSHDQNWNKAFIDSIAKIPPPGGDGHKPCVKKQSGSIIECENQVLGEEIPLAGMDMTLAYRSSTIPGRERYSTLRIPLLDSIVPTFLHDVRVEIVIGGRSFIQTYSPQANTTTNFHWDGVDAFGRRAVGAERYTVSVQYRYPKSYGFPANDPKAFGLRCLPQATTTMSFCFIPGVSDLEDSLTVSARDFHGTLGAWTGAAAQGFGGWTLSAQHVYDPFSQILYLGSGYQVTGREAIKPDRRALSGEGNFAAIDGRYDGFAATSMLHGTPSAVTVSPSGDVLFADSTNNLILAIHANGTMTVVAGATVFNSGGGSNPSSPQLGFRARNTQLSQPRGVALGTDGSVYIAESQMHRVLRVRPDSIVVLLAGTGAAGFSGDGGLATAAGLNAPSRVVTSPDGSLYVLDEGNARVRVITPAGTISTVAGGGTSAQCAAEGTVASASCLNAPADIAIAPNGTLYIVEAGRVRAIGANGLINTIAGQSGSSCSFAAYDGPAIGFQFCPRGIALDRDSRLFIFDGAFVRRVDSDGRMITTRSCGTGGPQASMLMVPVRTVASTMRGGPVADNEEIADDFLMYGREVISCSTGAVGPDRALYIGEEPGLVSKLSLPNPGYEATDFVIASPDGSEFYEFDVSLRHVGTSSVADGRRIVSFGYDTTGRLINIIDRVGQQIVVNRASNGAATSIRMPFGQTTAFQYDANGWLSSATYPDGSTRALTYATGGLLASFTNPVGTRTDFTYDSLGRFTSEDGPLGYHQSLAVGVDSLTGLQAVFFTNLAGLTTTHAVDDGRGGNLIRASVTTDGGQSRSTTQADGRNDTASPNGTTTQTQYTEDPVFGTQVQRLQTSSMRIRGLGTVTSAMQHTVQLGAAGDPRTVQRIMDSVTVNGRLTVTSFDVAARLAVDTHPDGRVDSTRVDSLGNVTRVKSTGLAAMLFTYDSFGRPTSAQVAGRTATTQYGLDGLMSATIDPLNRRTAYQRDLMGRVTGLLRPDSQLVQSVFDVAGRMTSFTPAGRSATLFAYDARGRVTSITQPATSTAPVAVTQYAYDAARLTAITHPDNQTLTHAYDGLGHLARDTGLGIDRVYSYTPSSGLLASISSIDGDTLTFTYVGGLVNSMTWSGRENGSVNTDYTTDLLPSRVSVSGGQSIYYNYGSDGKLQSVGDLSLTYDLLNGLPTGTSLGTVTSQSLIDSLGQVLSVTHSFGSTQLLAQSFSYDLIGRTDSLTEVQSNGTVGTAYQYDALGRLVLVRSNGTAVAIYQYDANGNRVRETTPLGVVTATYDQRDQLLTYGTTQYTYTPNGERLSKIAGSATTGYHFDVLGQLTGVDLPGAHAVTYEYDPAGHRVGRRLDGRLTQRFVYQSMLAPAAEYDSTGNLVAQYVYASHANVPDYMIRADGTEFRFVLDDRGSVRLVVDVATGAIAQQVDYDAWGRVTLNTNAGFQPFGYAGGLLDSATALVHFGAREYDPEVGQWISADPRGLDGGSANLYAYAVNDPIQNKDVLGLWSEKTHRALITAALPDHQGDVKAIADASALFDEPFGSGDPGYGNSQGTEDSYMHSMRAPNEDPMQAVLDRDAFITKELATARMFAEQCNFAEALHHLGIGIHPLMDMTSPFHVRGGIPQVWNGMMSVRAGWQHHEDEDREAAKHHPGDSLFRLNGQLILGAYNYVFHDIIR
ncbi:MAG: RHS repeat-associated core domain-containing protein [bacterium]